MATDHKSNNTQAWLKILREKKLDLFARIAIGIFGLEFATLIGTLLSALNAGTSWPVFLEFNGAALSMLGALWTALGVRLSAKEKEALLHLKKNTTVLLDEIINTLYAASHFATAGAYMVLVGGALVHQGLVLPLEKCTRVSAPNNKRVVASKGGDLRISLARWGSLHPQLENLASNESTS